MCPLNNAIKLNFNLPPKGAYVPFGVRNNRFSLHCILVPGLSIFQASTDVRFAFAPGLQRREF